jgi:nitroimidazol reductase NimA-like FMN-containing flavoprotein (pyridoxamine 5'-phosphate oxidase superfamily)
MRIIDDRTGIDVIERDECLQLLRSTDIGRIAVVDSGHPVILPVNYALDGELIVFRTAEGTKLDAALHGGPVAFEIDDADRHTRTAWSVVVTGWSRLVTTPSQTERFEALGLRPWSSNQKDNWIVVHPERISGRRIVALDDRRS